MDPASAEEEAEQQEYVASLRSPPFTLSREEVKRRQIEDEVLSEVREWVKNGQKPPLPTLKGKTAEYYIFRQQFEQLSLEEDGVLTIKRPSGPTTLGQMKLVLPASLYDRAFHFAHDHPSAGHFGVTAMLERLRKHVYWVGQAQFVENKIHLCHVCWNKANSCGVKDAQHRPWRVGYPLEILFVDLVGPLNPSTENYMYILSVQDGFSRFLTLYLLRSKNLGGGY